MTADTVLTGIAIIFAMAAVYEIGRRDKPWGISRLLTILVCVACGALFMAMR